MPRQIISDRQKYRPEHSPLPGDENKPIHNFPKPDDYKDRLLKLIPAEIVAAYLTIHGIVVTSNQSESNKKSLLIIVFVILTVLTPMYLSKFTKVWNWSQKLFTTGAFIVWVLAIGSPFQIIFGIESILIGSILLIIYTLFIPFVYHGN